LLEFGRYAIERRQRLGLGKPPTFNFLGFTFICGRSRRGAFLLRRHTRRDRMRAALQAVKGGLLQRRHASIPEQGDWLRSVVTGYFAYHAVPTNSQALCAFRHHVLSLWRRSLERRSQKAGVTWAKLDRLAAEWLPLPHVLHPWPEDRFAVKHPR
jgi:RNA-directed DNA polymerase